MNTVTVCAEKHTLRISGFGQRFRKVGADLIAIWPGSTAWGIFGIRGIFFFACGAVRRVYLTYVYE